jgi:arylsulfatase A-like enzyme
VRSIDVTTIDDRPNILVICTDQHRFDAISTHLGSPALTPHLNALAVTGAVFDHCYSPSPVCAPARASMLTGMYPSRHGLWANGVALPERDVLVTRQLADAGYRCGLVGKLHLSAAYLGRTEERADDGFESFEWAHDPFHGSPENAYHDWLRTHHPDLWEAARDDAVTPGFQGFKHANTAFDEMPVRGHYSTWVTERVTDFIRSRDDRPFMMLANFFDPHHPFAAPPEYLERYPAGSVPPPVGDLSELADKPAFQRRLSGMSYGGQGPAFADYTSAEIDEIRRTYYAMVTFVDDCVGRLTSLVRDEVTDRETLVVFLSDHGEMLGDHGLLLKGPMMYDAAVRVPLIVSWPNHVPAGARIESFVSSLDLAATLRSAAQLDEVVGEQGHDLVAIANGTPTRSYAWSEYRNAGFPYDPPVNTTMYRRKDFKLVVWHGSPGSAVTATGELYDMVRDPDEVWNLWSDPAFQDVKQELYAELSDVQMAHEDRTEPRLAQW